jgi:AraC-like DNA-binding protein
MSRKLYLLLKMLLNLLNLLAGFSLILLALIMLANYLRKQKINFFFFALLLMAGISRFQYALTTLHLLPETHLSNLRFFFLLFLTPPIFYLCLKSFIAIQTTIKDLLIHFSVFGLIILFRIINGEFPLFFLGLFFMVYTLIYYYFLFKITQDYIQQHRSIYSKQQLFKVKQLVIWIFALSFNNFILIVYHFLMNTNDKQVIIEHIFQSTIISWLLFLIYLLYNPNIIFNEVFKKKDANRDFLKEFAIWSNKPNFKTEAQDQSVETIMASKQRLILAQLNLLDPATLISCTSANLLSTLSKQLNYPKSHLKFIFKYYCRYSQSDYLNLMRLIHALNLINEGYLDNFTIETLGEKCHFNSRTSFYRHFKKHLGVSPSQFSTLIE